MSIARTETVQPDGAVVPIYIEVDTLAVLERADGTDVYEGEETRENAAQRVLTVAGDVAR